MPYPSGDKLDERIDEVGLRPLADLLYKVAAGSATWTQPKAITVSPDGREQIRNLIYALLHHAGVKQYFQVKAVSPDTLVIDKKIVKEYKVLGIQDMYLGTSAPAGAVTEIQPEDLSHVFDVDNVEEEEKEKGEGDGRED